MKIILIKGERVVPCRIDFSCGSYGVVKIKHKSTVVDGPYLAALAAEGGYVETDDPGKVIRACGLPPDHPSIGIIRPMPDWCALISGVIDAEGITRVEASARAGVPLRTLENWVGRKCQPTRIAAIAAIEKIKGDNNE